MVTQPPVLSTCYNHFIPIIVRERKRGACSLVHGNLPRQHSFGTTLRFTGPVPADSRQRTPSVRKSPEWAIIVVRKS